MLEQAEVNHTLYLGVTNLVNERTNRLRGITTTAQTAYGRHTWVIPTAYQSLFHQLEHLTFGHHGIGDIQAVELILAWAVVASDELVDIVVVEWTVYHELQRTDRVGYALKVVGLTVREVVHWIYVPCATCAMVRMGGDDAVHDWVAEVHVGISHVYLRTEYHLTVFDFTILHGLEKAKVLVNRAVAVWRCYTGFGRCTFLLSNLLCRLLIYIGFALFDELDGKVIELLEIVRSVVDIAPLESQPSDVLLYGIYIFHILFDGVGVVESQVAYAIVFLRNTKVHADGFHVTDMQVTIWLRRKTCLYASVVLTFL